METSASLSVVRPFLEGTREPNVFSGSLKPEPESAPRTKPPSLEICAEAKASLAARPEFSSFENYSQFLVMIEKCSTAFRPGHPRREQEQQQQQQEKQQQQQQQQQPQQQPQRQPQQQQHQHNTRLCVYCEKTLGVHLDAFNLHVSACKLMNGSIGPAKRRQAFENFAKSTWETLQAFMKSGKLNFFNLLS